MEKQHTSISNTGNIPLVVTEEHQQVFPFWYNSGIRAATLIHVDSHSDLGDDSLACWFKRSLSNGYHKKLDQTNFICPSVHYGIVNEMIWISPFQKDTGVYIQYMSKDILKTRRSFRRLKWANLPSSYASWPPKLSFNEEDVRCGETIDPKDMGMPKFRSSKTILDIDLDAFAKEIYGPAYITELIEALTPGIGTDGWESRIEETSGLLKMIVTPSIITLTRSQGDPTYVPSYMVDKVQKETISMLSRIYS